MRMASMVFVFLRRRGVAALIRRLESALADPAAGPAPSSPRSSSGRAAQAARLARSLMLRGWRAVDTDANARRVERFVARMRAEAGTVPAQPARTTDVAV